MLGRASIWSIDKSPSAWKKVRDDRRFRAHWQLEGDSLKTAPRGFAKDHPMLEDLRRKDHIAVVRLKKHDVTRKDLVPFVAECFAHAKAYMAWQAKALKLRF